MAGKKGRSGRGSRLDDKTADEIMSLSAMTLRHALSPRPDGTYELPFTLRAELASRIFIKAMPQRVEDERPPQQIVIVRSDGHKAQELPRPIHILRSPVSGDGVSVGNGQKPMLDSEGS